MQTQRVLLPAQKPEDDVAYQTALTDLLGASTDGVEALVKTQ